MTPAALAQTLDELIAGWENECVEVKEANDNFSYSDIGKYFSALANEANLRGRTSGWLVFGVQNKRRAGPARPDLPAAIAFARRHAEGTQSAQPHDGAAARRPDRQRRLAPLPALAAGRRPKLGLPKIARR